MPHKHRPRSVSPSSGPVAAVRAVALSPAARSEPVLPALVEAEAPQQHPLRLASLVALFGLGRRRSTGGAVTLPNDDPYLAYLRWAADRSAPSAATAADRSALDDGETAAA